jgi:hypothetical protein
MPLKQGMEQKLDMQIKIKIHGNNSLAELSLLTL